MAQEISTTVAPASLDLGLDPRKWTTPCVISALRGDPQSWDAKLAKQQLAEQRIDVPTELRRANAALAPVAPDWLAQRLRVLWKSSTPTNSMSAKEWLHETGRLTKHLPQDIVAHAIDEAATTSRFTPTAADILAVATQILADRKLQRDRLDLLVNGPKRGPYPWEVDRLPPKVEDVCTPEEAAAIKAAFNINDVEAERKPSIDASRLRMPGKDELAKLAAEFNAGRPA